MAKSGGERRRTLKRSTYPSCNDSSVGLSRYFVGTVPGTFFGHIAPTTPPPTPFHSTRAPTTQTNCSNFPNAMTVNFGYYQSWAIWRQSVCNRVYPADIDVDGNGYTHLAYSFASINIGGKLEPWAGDYNGEVQQYADFNAIKSTYPHLKTMIAVGGWTFNDLGATQTRFSNVASTPESRAEFATSVVDFLRTYQFDGIDFDWEYLADAGRGGVPADKQNYALLIEAVRNAFNSEPEDFEITMAIPVSTSKLDVGYNLVSLSQNVDFFHLMSYDIHGAWDMPQVVGSHSDVRVIENTINYMLQQGTPPNKIVIGLGMYGRIYRLSDPACRDTDCPISGAANGGCAGADGFMPNFTIDEYVSAGLCESIKLNPATGSMELVIDGNKWISYDNKETFEIKASYAANACLWFSPLAVPRRLSLRRSHLLSRYPPMLQSGYQRTHQPLNQLSLPPILKQLLRPRLQSRLRRIQPRQSSH